MVERLLERGVHAIGLAGVASRRGRVGLSLPYAYVPRYR